jgi:hypothetical protein
VNELELTCSSANVDAAYASENNEDVDQQEQPRFRLWRQQGNGDFLPISDSSPEDNPTEQISTQRDKVNDDKGLALKLATLPEVKTNFEAGGELPTSEELPSISQQVSQSAEEQEVEEVVAKTTDGVSSATGPDEPY